MASSQSTINRYDNINLFRQENLPMLAQQLTMKQGVVDQTKMMLDNLQTELGINLDLARDEDKAYLQQRLSQATGLVNNALSRGADISDPTISKMLFNQMKEVVNDQNILNAVVSTKKIRQLQAEMDWYRTNDPTKYSDINASVAGKGIIKYLNSEGIGQVYSGGNYTPYVDVYKKLIDNDINKTLKDMNINTEFIQTEDGGGYFKTQSSYEGTVSPERLKQAIIATIGSDGYKQWEIESEYMYGDGDDVSRVDLLRNQFNEQNNSELGVYKNQLETRQTMLASATTKAEKDKLTNEINQLQKSIDQVSSRDFNNLISDNEGFINRDKFRGLANNMYTFGQQEKMFSIFYQDPILKDRKVDDVSYKNTQFGMEIQKMQFDQQMRTANFNLSLQRANLDLQKAIADGKVDASGNAIIGVINNSTVLSDHTVMDNVIENIDALVRSEYYGARDEVANTFFGGNFELGAQAEMVNFLNSNDNIASMDKIVVAGKEIPITPTTLTMLDKFKQSANGESGFRKIRKEEGYIVVDYGMQELMQAYSTDSQRADVDRVIRGMENYKFKRVGGSDENPEYITEKVDNNYYKRLLSKIHNGGTLSKSEYASLKLAVGMNIVASNEKLNRSEKIDLYRGVQDELVKSVGYKAVNGIPKFEDVERGIGVAPPTDPYTPTAYSAIGALTNTVANIISPSTTFTNRKEYNVIPLDDIQSIKRSLNSNIDSYHTITNTVRDEAMKSQTQPVSHPFGSTQHKTLATQAGLPANYKDPIYTVRDATDPTKVRIGILGKNDKETTKTTAQLPIEWVKQRGTEGELTAINLTVPIEGLGIPFTRAEKTPYDSDLKNPSVLQLGSSADKSRNNGKDVNYKPFINLDARIVELKRETTPEQQATIDALVREYKNGDINFEVSRGDRQGASYKIMMNIPKFQTSVEVLDTKVQKLYFDSEIPQLFNNVSTQKELYFLEFLNSQLR